MLTNKHYTRTALGRTLAHAFSSLAPSSLIVFANLSKRNHLNRVCVCVTPVSNAICNGVNSHAPTTPSPSIAIIRARVARLSALHNSSPPRTTTTVDVRI